MYHCFLVGDEVTRAGQPRSPGAAAERRERMRAGPTTKPSETFASAPRLDKPKCAWTDFDCLSQYVKEQAKGVRVGDCKLDDVECLEQKAQLVTAMEKVLKAYQKL